MASGSEESTSSSDDEFDYLKPPSWKHGSAVQIIDIPSRDGHRSQNLEPDAGRNNDSKVVLSEKIDMCKLRSPSVEKSVLDTSYQIQKLPLNGSDQISNGKRELETTGVPSPTSAKSYVVLSGELQGRDSNMQDAECQTVLTGEFLAGLAGLEKVRDGGSQTISTGDVISLNLFNGDICSSDFKPPNSTCDPLNDGLYDRITMKDIENHVNVLQGNIRHFFQSVTCTA